MTATLIKTGSGTALTLTVFQCVVTFLVSRDMLIDLRNALTMYLATGENQSVE